MFYHAKKLQYFKPPERPDPVYAMKIQELIGGVFVRSCALALSTIKGAPQLQTTPQN